MKHKAPKPLDLISQTDTVEQRAAPSEAFAGYQPRNAADKSQMPKYRLYDDSDVNDIFDAQPKVEI